MIRGAANLQGWGMLNSNRVNESRIFDALGEINHITRLYSLLYMHGLKRLAIYRQSGLQSVHKSWTHHVIVLR